MSSSFDGQDVFGDGPHRFLGGRRGSQLYAWSLLTGDDLDVGVVAIASRPIVVEVEGWLVGATAAELNARREVVLAASSYPPTVGALVDHDGREWAGLAFTEYEETGPVVRGRAWAVPFRAEFRELAATP